MFLTATALVLLARTIVISLAGTVRDAENGRVLSGACVEVRPGPVTACSDAAGTYHANISPGSHEIRVRRVGYSAQLVEINVGLDSAMHVDFELAPLPRALQAMRVTTRPYGTSRIDSDDSSAVAEAGAWQATSDQIRGQSLATGSDVLRAAALAAGMAASPEAPTSLHVRGGAGDQNLVLLDGVPLFNATHIGGILSAVNPDVVRQVTLHAGVPSARFGDALSSVIEIQTEAPTLGRPLFRGAVDVLTARQSVVGPLFAGRGSFALAGRMASRSLAGLAVSQSSTVADVRDGFAKATAPLAGGALEAFAFTTRDRLGFDAHPSSDKKAIGAASDSTVARPGISSAAPDRNAFGWTSTTGALIWTRHAEAATDVRLRLWRTVFSGTFAWSPMDDRRSLRSSFLESGVAGDVVRRTTGGRLSAGFSLQARNARYRVKHLSSSRVGAIPAPFGSSVRAPLVALYAEEQLGAGQRWTMTGGLRGGFTIGQLPWIDPRFSWRYGFSSRLSFLAGYARMHQSLQSLRNEESLVDALVGAGLPTMANGSDVPVGQSDQIAIGAALRVSENSSVRVETYARRMDHLLLVAPTTAQPFAEARALSGSGRASGVSAQFEHEDARVSARAGYAFSVSERVASGIRYRPSFGAAHSVAASVALHLRSQTDLQAAFHGLFGRSGWVSAGDVEWPAGGPLAGFDDLGGAPQTLLGPSNVARLSAFARLDVGVQRGWRVPGFGRDGRLTLSAAVENVLGRTNALAVTQSTGPISRRLLPMVPRALRLGVEWVF